MQEIDRTCDTEGSGNERDRLVEAHMKRLDILAHAADCVVRSLTDQTAMCLTELPVTCTAAGCAGATFGDCRLLSRGGTASSSARAHQAKVIPAQSRVRRRYALALDVCCATEADRHTANSATGPMKCTRAASME